MCKETVRVYSMLQDPPATGKKSVENEEPQNFNQEILK
jgi:hypothetical protein